MPVTTGLGVVGTQSLLLSLGCPALPPPVAGLALWNNNGCVVFLTQPGPRLGTWGSFLWICSKILQENWDSGVEWLCWDHFRSVMESGFQLGSTWSWDHGISPCCFPTTEFLLKQKEDMWEFLGGPSVSPALSLHSFWLLTPPSLPPQNKEDRHEELWLQVVPVLLSSSCVTLVKRLSFSGHQELQHSYQKNHIMTKRLRPLLLVSHFLLMLPSQNENQVSSRKPPLIDFPVTLSFLHFLKIHVFFKILIWLCQVLFAACRIFSCGMKTLSCGMWDPVPWPGTEPWSSALGAQSLSHWTTREVPFKFVFNWGIMAL